MQRMAGTFTMICGTDDYLVAREGAARWATICRDVEDPYSREVVDAGAGNVSEVEKAVASFTAAVQTMPMFGGKKCVWLKNVSFLGDTPTSRSEGAKTEVEKLLKVLAGVKPADVGVLITVCPVDRRKKEFKRFQELGDVAVVGGDAKSGDSPAQHILEEELAAHRARRGVRAS